MSFATVTTPQCLSRLERGRLLRFGWKEQARRPRCRRGSARRGLFSRSADAGSCSCRKRRRRRLSESLVDYAPNGASAAPTCGTASQAPVDLARRSDGAFGRNGSDLVIRNDVARTHDHDGTPGSMRCFMCLRTRKRVHPDDNVSLPFRDDVRQVQ